jgi:hypothetical protein
VDVSKEVQEHTPPDRLDDDIDRNILFGIGRSFHLPGRQVYTCHYLEVSGLVSSIWSIPQRIKLSASPQTSLAEQCTFYFGTFVCRARGTPHKAMIIIVIMLRSAEDLRYDWRDKHEKAFRETAGSERRQSITGGKENITGCTATRDLLSSMKRVLSYWRICQRLVTLSLGDLVSTVLK